MATILPFLVFNPIMYTISETTHRGIEFKKKSYYNIVIALVACIVNVTGNLLLVPRYACEGAAMSTGISYIVFFALRTFFSLRLYKADYKLWRFTIMTVMALIFAFYNTFYASFIISLMMFVICMGALLFLYRDSLKDLIAFIFSQLNIKKE